MDRFTRRKIETARKAAGRSDLTDDEIAELRAFFERPGAVACPCCGFVTLGGRGGFELCEVCVWEDDGQDDDDADTVHGGPNGSLSLSAARGNFRAFGACDERVRESVRSPRPDEFPDTP